jgi:signal transduction histidine kinase
VNEEWGLPQLNALHQIGLRLQASGSLGALAKGVVQALSTTLDYKRCAVLLVDRNAGRLKPFALSEEGYGSDFPQALNTYEATHDLRLKAGYLSSVVDNGQSLLIGDVPAVLRRETAHYEILSAVCVPIRIEDVIVGVISAESNRYNAFTRSDQKLLEIVASQLAIAIQNAHLQSRVSQDESIRGPASSLIEDEAISGQLSGEMDEVSEARFRAIVKELQAQNEELNAFNHTVAHDLKNPLSILIGFAEVLAQDYGEGDDEVLAQGIKVILENGRRMENIIRELLLLAEVRQLDEVAIEPLNMASIIVETRNRLSNLIAEYRAKITVPAAWPTAVGHRPWVEEIWVNYLSNAIKYGGSPPKVELGAMVQSDGMIRFWVRDNGKGISKEDQRRIFVPFTKLQQVNTSGHGLGLSIVQRITSKLGGTVGVESDPGAGSLFWFTLPMAGEKSQPEA